MRLLFPAAYKWGGGGEWGRGWDKNGPSVKQSVSLGPANPDFSKSPNLCVSEREEQHTQMFSLHFQKSALSCWDLAKKDMKEQHKKEGQIPI